MQIKRLYVKNFRNIREQEFCFHENVNVLCGNNAQGKTNLCEAISLCMGPSFRTSRQSSYIPFSLDNSKEKCVIKMWFTTSFNTDSENEEYSILIPTDKFAQVVSLMVYSGKQFEEHYGKMVFGGGDSNE